jgi:hypothetical protein
VEQQDAFRDMKNRVLDQIIALEPKHAEQVAFWTDAVNANQYCEKLVRDRQSPDPNDPVFDRVRVYLNT